MNIEKSYEARNTIAMEIASELLDEGILNESNFSYDIETLLQCTSNIVQEHLKDYVLVSGTFI